MAEIGLDLSHEFPKRLTADKVQAADVVITMGCGDACPIYPGKRYEDWDLPDPAGLDLAAVRPIRDDIARSVQQLLTDLVQQTLRSWLPGGDRCLVFSCRSMSVTSTPRSRSTRGCSAQRPPSCGRAMPTSPSPTRRSKLVLNSPCNGPGGTINHLGVEVGSAGEVARAGTRLDAEGLDTEPESGAICCYAWQDKVWAHDPDGVAWEYYAVLEHIETP
jgi:hypothetical protein